MLARDLMTCPAITCHVNDTLADAARKMWDADIGAVAVVNDDGKLTGMITDRDICMAGYTQGRALDEILVNSAIAKDVAAAPPDAPLPDVARLMARHQVRRIPIVDASGGPVGLVSLNDLATADAPAETATAATLAAICRHRSSIQQVA
jgi:CBS domain-containing protein